MNHIHRISYLASGLAAFTCAMLGLIVSAPAAFGVVPAIDGGSGGSGVAPTGPSSAANHTIAASGMAAWQITLVVVVVAVLTAVIAIAVDRARAAHRTGMVPAT
jgi:hypothetical protein